MGTLNKQAEQAVQLQRLSERAPRSEVMRQSGLTGNPNRERSAEMTDPNKWFVTKTIFCVTKDVGGIVRWVAAPGEEPSSYGNTASLGEVSLSAFTGGTAGLTGAHVIFEPNIFPEVATSDLGDGASRTHRHHRSNRKTTTRTRLAPYISGSI